MIGERDFKAGHIKKQQEQPWPPYNCYISCDVCLLAPGSFPDEDGGFGPDPGTHSDSRTKHGEQVDFLYHEAGPVLNGAFWDWLVGLRGDCHVCFAPVEDTIEMIDLCIHHSTSLPNFAATTVVHSNKVFYTRTQVF